MPRFPRLALLLVVASLVGAPATVRAKGEPPYTTPAKGTALRKELVDIVREHATDYFGQNIVFSSDTLRTARKWALFVGRATKANGHPIDYSTVPYYRENPKELNPNVVYGGVYALLKKHRSGWRIVCIGYDPSDAAWANYDTRFHAPRGLIREPIDK